MICQIRGTSGSGKSTAMRKAMEVLGEWEPMFRPNRKQPLYYQSVSHPIIVLGHYNANCGGCDTVGSARAVVDLIKELLPTVEDVVGTHVLAEGLLLSEDVLWTSQLPDVKVLYLITPLEQCLKQIQQRRAEAGNEKPLNPKNTENRVRVIERSRTRLTKLGVYCRSCSVGQVPKLITSWLLNA